MHSIFDAIEKYVLQNNHNLLEHVPKQFFHYTDAGGAIGILSSGKIWASNLGYLNDSTEFNYARDLIVSCIEEKFNKATNKKVVNVFKRIFKNIKKFDNGHTSFFIACFCENGDQLSQWRGYGANGGGYSIAFYPNLIGKRPKFGEPEFDIRPIIYERKKQEKLVNSFLEIVIEQLLSNKVKLNELKKPEIINDIIGFLLDYLLIFKDPSFKEEKEWRLIILADIDRVKFRPQNSNIVPYVEVDLAFSDDNNTKGLPLSSVVVGPTINQHRAVNSIQWLLRKYDHDELEVKTSSIPLVN
ncbi:MAG: DUF2971 domain-containing protein [gamma proteobacterium symbiont of Taylorina sp.]|nr:DUF2971 domain-containing protein [gamma proteobacterium symbiont of Taylorina sp.]